jgi:hypothetical protein
MLAMVSDLLRWPNKRLQYPDSVFVNRQFHDREQRRLSRRVSGGAYDTHGADQVTIVAVRCQPATEIVGNREVGD